jgi:hypothetical protein
VTAGRARAAPTLTALVAWAAFCAALVSGFPPPVDLPAHGAQLQTMVELLRGAEDVRSIYALRFPVGYGLPYWLALPLAWVTSGAFAIRAVLWASLVLWPVSVAALLRALGRSAAAAVLALPLAFNLSYWYGLVSGLFAQPLALLALAAYLRSLQDARRRWVVLSGAAATASMLSHLVAFAAVGLLVGAAALAGADRRLRAWRAAQCLALPALVSLAKVWEMATRAVTPGDWPATEYNLAAHVGWFFRNYRPEGWLAAAGPLAVTAALTGVWWWRRRAEPPLPAVLFWAGALLYAATPKTLSGIYLIAMRLPVFAGALALALADWRDIPRWLRGAALAVTLWSLGETALFHARFRREVSGLEALIQGGRPGPHGYHPVGGTSVLGSRHIYAEHLGQWWTATRGGVGHHFFADAEHHPVTFRPGASLPARLEDAPDQVGRFEEILAFGDGPLPEWLRGFEEVAREGHWRKLRRRAR